VIALTAVLVAISGCGGGDNPQPIPPEPPNEAQPIATTRCTESAGGTLSRRWRQDPLVTAGGPVGFYGNGRNFLKGDMQPKVPIIVEGREPVTVSVAPEDRSHALLVVRSGSQWGSFAEVRFVPCRDRPRTWWPAGFRLRNRQPVAIVVQRQGEERRRLKVGRV
jgi:hypothetical protein